MDELSDKISSLLNSPEGLEKVRAMASMLSAAGGSSSVSPPPEKEEPSAVAEAPSEGGSGAGSLLSGLMDPSLMFKLLPLIGQLNGPVNDPRINLLMALKPYVKGEGMERIDDAVQILKLSKLAGIVMKSFDIKLF